MRFDTHQDAVVDVKWSPVHPAVFASIDQTGTVIFDNTSLLLIFLVLHLESQ